MFLKTGSRPMPRVELHRKGQFENGEKYEIHRVMSYVDRNARFPTRESFELTIGDGKPLNFISEDLLDTYIEGYIQGGRASEKGEAQS